jgi:hypothetical protein
VVTEFVSIQNNALSGICKQSGLRYTHTYVTVRVANPVLSFLLRNILRKGKESLRSLKIISSLDSVEIRMG